MFLLGGRIYLQMLLRMQCCCSSEDEESPVTVTLQAKKMLTHDLYVAFRVLVKDTTAGTVLMSSFKITSAR